MARPRRELSAEDVRRIEILAGYGLTLPQIAAVLGISERTLHRRKDERRVLAALQRGRARAAKQVGRALFRRAVEERDVKAIQWWEMTRLGHHKVERHEHTGEGGGPVRHEARVVFYLPSNGRDAVQSST